METHFINESENRKLRILFLFIFIILIIISFSAFIGTFTGKENLLFISSFQKIQIEMINTTSEGLFYSGFFGGLFFLPIPQELFFYLGLIRRNQILLSFILINAGYMLAQFVNYYIGLKMSTVFMSIVSRKKVYKARRWTNKYGSYGIFWFNFLPLPAPLLTFALGITKYNLKRLTILTLAGTTAKYSAIIIFYLIMGNVFIK